MNIAILGYGVVGKGVEKMALENKMKVSHILMRDIDELTKANMTSDLNKILNDNELNCVVECIGGDEPAFTYVKKTLEKGINVVSSNKKMIAKHYSELIALANKNHVSFLFSSACGGAIPFLPTLSNVKSSDDLKGFEGIINGTSNYILNKMYYENIGFNEALKKAQELGYAESDPSDDIDGIDTLNKTVLALGVGFNVLVKPEDVFVKGIRNYNLADLKFIKEKDYHACLLAKASKVDNKYFVRVMPSFVKEDNPFYSIRANYNCLVIKADNLGTLSLIGQGAGSLHTASNVIRDIQMLNNPYLVNLEKEIKPNDEEYFGYYYLRTCKKINVEYIQEDLGNNTYITKKISLNVLREIVGEQDFVGEIIDD